MREHEKEELQDFGKTSATKKPCFGLIPYASLCALAERFELGEKKHAEKAWNGLSKNQDGLDNPAWVRSRVEHIINHAFLYLQKMEGLIPDDGDDDAAAIMFGGCVLFEAKRREMLNSSGERPGAPLNSESTR